MTTIIVHLTAMTSLTAQAERILDQAKELDAYLLANNLQSPSIDNDSLVGLTPDHEAIRVALVDSTHNLKRLAQGTVGATVETLMSVSTSFSLPNP